LGEGARARSGRTYEVRSLRPAWAEVDLSSISHNARVLAAAARPAALCAVVKAGGYGHGAIEVSRAALRGGAQCLAVATVEEGRELRRAGVDAPVLVLSEPPTSALSELVAWRLTPTIYTWDGLAGLRQVAASAPQASPYPVQVKVDTGMHRVGAEPTEAIRLACAVAGDPALSLDGLWTHFAVADEPASPFTSTQLDRFERAVAELLAAGVRPRTLHAANSAGLLWHPRSRFDMVRCGITLYGLVPSQAQSAGLAQSLAPALSLKAEVSYVKPVAAGEGISYGLRYRTCVPTTVATVPLGYADGVPRSLAASGGQVLIRGRRLPIAGTVTMDQLLVDCGPDAEVAVGDEVVLIGSQGEADISAWEWARLTGTIAYEVVCGISARVPRVHLDAEGEPL